MDPFIHRPIIVYMAFYLYLYHLYLDYCDHWQKLLIFRFLNNQTYFHGLSHDPLL